MNSNQNIIKNTIDYMSTKMPSVNSNHYNPVETLTIRDIEYLQTYLDRLKTKKIKESIDQNKLEQDVNQKNIDYNKFKNGSILGSNANQRFLETDNDKNLSGVKTKENRATDIFNPMDREVPIDWRSFTSSQSNDLQPIFGSTGSIYTRPGKRSQQTFDVKLRDKVKHGSSVPSLTCSFGDKVKHGSSVPSLTYSFGDKVKHGNPSPSLTCSFGDKVNQNSNYINPYEYGAKQNIMRQHQTQPYNNIYNNNLNTLDTMGISKNMHSEYFPNNIRNVNIESSLLQRETTHNPNQQGITEKEVNRFELLPFDPQDHTHIVWTDNMPRSGYATRTERLEY